MFPEPARVLQVVPFPVLPVKIYCLHLITFALNCQRFSHQRIVTHNELKIHTANPSPSPWVTHYPKQAINRYKRRKILLGSCVISMAVVLRSFADSKLNYLRSQFTKLARQLYAHGTHRIRHFPTSSASLRFPGWLIHILGVSCARNYGLNSLSIHWASSTMLPKTALQGTRRKRSTPEL